jgi:hypothetical protein
MLYKKETTPQIILKRNSKVRCSIHAKVLIIILFYILSNVAERKEHSKYIFNLYTPVRLEKYCFIHEHMCAWIYAK